MHREGEKIYFDEHEQAEFGVQPMVSVQSALETMDGIEVAADSIANRLELGQSEDIMTPDVAAKQRADLVRSYRLRSFSRLIARHCAPEIAERMIAEANQSD